MEHTINRERTIYGYDEVYKFMVTNPRLVNNGHNNEYRYRNTVFSLNKYDMAIRIYTNETDCYDCIASLILGYDDFAIQYSDEIRDILILSRKDTVVSPELFMSIKGIMA